MVMACICVKLRTNTKQRSANLNTRAELVCRTSATQRLVSVFICTSNIIGYCLFHC